MKLSRRQLVFAAAALSQAAPAQTPPPEPPPDLLQQARDANRRNSDALSKVELPASVEPAFQFRA